MALSEYDLPDRPGEVWAKFHAQHPFPRVRGDEPVAYAVVMN